MRLEFGMKLMASTTLLLIGWLSGCNVVLGNKSPDDLKDTGQGLGGDGNGSTTSGEGGSTGDGDTTGDGDATGDTGTAANGCKNGTYDHDDNPDTVCQSWSKCSPGEYISENGTSTSDRECSACPSKTFSESQNQSECTPHTECEAGSRVTTKGTKTDDVECGPCAAGYTSNGGYVETCAACPEGTFNSESGSSECMACPSGSFADNEASTSCEPWGLCDWTENIAQQATASQDVECEPGEIFRQVDTDGYDSFTSVAVDADENVYVTGHTRGHLEDYEEYYYSYSCYYYGSSPPEECDTYDGILIKYDKSGEQIWKRQFGGAAHEYPQDVTVDDKGNIYVVGYTSGDFQGTSEGSYDAFLVKYSPDGDQEMISQFGTSTTDYAYGVAIDGSGGIYVAGYTYGTLGDDPATIGGNADMYVRKLSASGLTAWTQQFGGTSNEYAYDIDVDDDGWVYLAGTYQSPTFLDLTNSGSNDMVVLRFDPEADPIAPQAHKLGGRAESESLYAVEALGGGDYVAGGRYPLSHSGASTFTYYVGYVARRSFSDGPSWTYYLYGHDVAANGSYSNDVRDVAVDANGDVLALGYSGTKTMNGQTNPGGTSIFAARIDGTGSGAGDLKWVNFYGADNGGSIYTDYGYGVAFGPSGRAYAAGSSYGRFGASGSSSNSSGVLIMVDVPGLEN